MKPSAAARRPARDALQGVLQGVGRADDAPPRHSLRVLLAALLLATLLLGEALGGAGATALSRDHGGPAIDEASQLRQGALREASRLLAVANGPTQARSRLEPAGGCTSGRTGAAGLAAGAGCGSAMHARRRPGLGGA